jgi:hypothetical protein
MATPDIGIQKSVVPTENLPASTVDGYYYIRYRIVSDDQSQYSEWSVKHKLKTVSVAETISAYNALLPEGADPVSIVYKVYSTDETMYLSWNVPEILKRNTFDVFVQWWTGQGDEPGTDPGDWAGALYCGVVKGNTFDINIPEIYRSSNMVDKYARFLVQLPSTTKQISDQTEEIRLFSTEFKTTRGKIDAGLVP